MLTTLRDGRYKCFGTLGEGSQGITYNAIDQREGRPVAIKQFQVRGARSWKDVELAEREARVLSRLEHPRLPAYLDHFEEDGSLYLVMERIEGKSLAQLRSEGGSLGEEDVVRLLRDASEVLSYLHGRAPPIIHRDLKPGNVIRRPDGSYAFVDFGAVRDKLRPAGGSTVVGTFGYMAPEQFQGRANPATDVYAIGATAITMLSGIEPEDLPHKGLGINVGAALGDPALAKPLTRALARMLDPDPDTRAHTIAELLAGLGSTSSRKPTDPPKAKAPSPKPAGGPRGKQRIDRARERWEREMSRARKSWEWWPEAAREEWNRSLAEGRREWDKRVAEARSEWEQSVDRDRQRADKRAQKHAQRQSARAERAQRHGRRPDGGSLALRLGAGLALNIASAAVVLTLCVFVPLLLTLLSIAFGPKLRRASAAVIDAGRRADAAIDRARLHLNERLSPAPPPGARVRVETAPPAVRVRVSGGQDGQAQSEVDAEAEAEAEAHPSRSSRRR